MRMICDVKTDVACTWWRSLSRFVQDGRRLVQSSSAGTRSKSAIYRETWCPCGSTQECVSSSIFLNAFYCKPYAGNCTPISIEKKKKKKTHTHKTLVPNYLSQPGMNQNQENTFNLYGLSVEGVCYKTDALTVKLKRVIKSLQRTAIEHVFYVCLIVTLVDWKLHWLTKKHWHVTCMQN